MLTTSCHTLRGALTPPRQLAQMTVERSVATKPVVVKVFSDAPQQLQMVLKTSVVRLRSVVLKTHHQQFKLARPRCHPHFLAIYRIDVEEKNGSNGSSSHLFLAKTYGSSAVVTSGFQIMQGCDIDDHVVIIQRKRGNMCSTGARAHLPRINVLDERQQMV